MDPVTQKPLKYSLDSTPAPSHTWPTQEDPAPGRKERSDRPCAEGDYESLVARVSMRRVFCELFLNLINSVWLEMFPINRHHWPYFDPCAALSPQQSQTPTLFYITQPEIDNPSYHSSSSSFPPKHRPPPIRIGETYIMKFLHTILFSPPPLLLLPVSKSLLSSSSRTRDAFTKEEHSRSFVGRHLLFNIFTLSIGRSVEDKVILLLGDPCQTLVRPCIHTPIHTSVIHIS